MDNVNIAEMIPIRDKFIQQIKDELLGPGSEYSIPDKEHEIISSSPEKRYSIGILFPQNNQINSENGESLKVEETEELDEEDVQEIENDNSLPEGERRSRKGHTESEEDNLDEEIGLAAQNLPSSIGITFFINSATPKITVNLSFAIYKKVDAKDCRVPFNPKNLDEYTLPSELESYIRFDKESRCLKWISKLSKKEIRELDEKDFLENDEYGIINCLYKLAEQLKAGYVRIPHLVKAQLDFTKEDYIDNNKDLDGTMAKITALRRKISSDLYSMTIMLVNSDQGKPRGNNCIFQPVISVETAENEFNFCEYNNLSSNVNMDDEEQSLSLQYRDKKVYGTGLGTALDWDIDKEGRGILYNNFVPETEVPSMDFELSQKYNIPKPSMSMKYLSDLDKSSKEEKISLLKNIVGAYESWISELDIKLGELQHRYKEAAIKNIENCRKSLERMNKGIRILETNGLTWDAFSLANRAMFMQRVHLELQEILSDKDRYPYDEELEEKLRKINYSTEKDKYFWRPFQIAFLLMSIESITNDNSEDRELVDLIWFPTGGGKTEAYLGLTAFTIFYRRLAHLKESSGTTVVMRYTLRLLAAQQFTRAATLICACEFIRKEGQNKRSSYKRYKLGEDSITIGLWIGSKHTPNKNSKAKEFLDKLNDESAGDLRYRKDVYNKFQVLKCPWCGTKLVKDYDYKNNREKGQWGYKLRNSKHFYLSCPQEECDFNNTLPIQIVDEELYDNPPSLLFGTVDKFAMLPWNSKIGSFFATENSSRPPELIIQDELHLISGPLGTMVGLYEAAIDALCSSKGIKFKVVASTATIRRAKEQCSALYNREVAQFPSPGLDAEDSFFAKESILFHKQGIFGRKYIGLMPSGKTKAMMEVRTIAALLQKTKLLNIDDSIKDKLWTLTVYFNSLKDLGKCSTLIDDDVKDFIKRMAYRLGSAKDARVLGRADELTSRVSTTELNETLDKLEKLQYSEENIKNKHYASNTLLATNMISVGIDVARLNIMLLVGQPKLTSEYIQASSRVGRKYPGMAFTMYDGSKSRDRSHYEQFKPYHESFYRYVEPTGVTPYSQPARERALHAIIVAMIRHMNAKLLKEDQAGNFKKNLYANEIKIIKDYIVDRDYSITQRLESVLDDNGADIEREIELFFDDWEELSESYGEGNLFYGEKFMFKHPEENQGRILKVFNSQRYDMSAKDTMTSMRNVDSMVASNVLIWED